MLLIINGQYGKTENHPARRIYDGQLPALQGSGPGPEIYGPRGAEGNQAAHLAEGDRPLEHQPEAVR